MIPATRQDHASELRAALRDPRALVHALGLRVTARQSRGVTVLCPWHGERSGSCSVTLGPDGTIRVHCFGCDAGSDALGLIAHVNGLDARRDFGRVCDLAADIARIRLDAPTTVVQRRPSEPPRLADSTFTAIIEQLDPLEAQPDVRSYVAARLPGADLADLRALPLRYRDLDAFRARIVATVGADAWQQSGLARRDGKWLFTEHRLVIPWRRTDGVVSTVQRRMLRDPQPGERVGKYVFATGRAPRRPYGVEQIASMGPVAGVAFVEGALDTLALRTIAKQEGFTWCVLGIAGVSAWDRAFALHARDRVAVVALDGDRAGNEAVAKVAADLRAAGAVDVKRARPTRGKDWAEMLRGAHD